MWKVSDSFKLHDIVSRSDDEHIVVEPHDICMTVVCIKKDTHGAFEIGDEEYNTQWRYSFERKATKEEILQYGKLVKENVK